MEARIRELFERYERVFERSLTGDADREEMASFYAPEFIGASPAGVMTGKNDAGFGAMMAEGHARYRAIGAQRMRIRHLRIAPIDTRHCVAHVAWTATYARPDLPEVMIDFDVHYLVQTLDEEPRIFGWVSGDEQALLRQRGVI
ncbi:MAG TPA: nuclear transport factor 2 family protein [Roseomonas sp.]|jgi:hypothetical protein